MAIKGQNNRDIENEVPAPTSSWELLGNANIPSGHILGTTDGINLNIKGGGKSLYLYSTGMSVDTGIDVSGNILVNGGIDAMGSITSPSFYSENGGFQGSYIIVKDYPGTDAIVLNNSTATFYNQVKILNVNEGNRKVLTSDANGLATWKDVGLVGYSVATLPTTAIMGDMAYVTDAVAPTYLNSLTGGGSIKCPVFYNGTIWVSH